MLTINKLQINTDSENRYSLNDLFRASGSKPKHKPATFFKLSSVQRMAELLKVGNPTFQPFIKKQGRHTGGTWVCKELVYKYAMWISGEFELKVIQSFDAMSQGDYAKADAIINNKDEVLNLCKQRDILIKSGKAAGVIADELVLIEKKYIELGAVAAKALGARRGEANKFKIAQDFVTDKIQQKFEF